MSLNKYYIKYKKRRIRKTLYAIGTQTLKKTAIRGGKEKINYCKKMNINKYKIKDDCRKNLNKYTIQAFSIIPKIENPTILDIGCGTGEPSLAIINNCNGIIYAVDHDEASLSWFNEKVITLNLSDRIKIYHDSILNPLQFKMKFDIVVAEGLLNVIGFEKGLSILLQNIKNNGYLLIHDELKNDSEKKTFFKKNNLIILDSFQLNDDVWWNEYYNCLEIKIQSLNNDELFKNEIKEINDYKIDSQSFKSIYYILQNKI